MAVLRGPQGPGPTAAAPPPAPGVVVEGGADHHLALQVHRLVGAQELEGFEPEAGVGLGAGGVGVVGVVLYAAGVDKRKS